jgi:uncharacterized membrane protein YphA (DoxX/SURF4 family)
MSIYVEIRIRGKLDGLWRMTQTPHLHAQWDLRFSEIQYLLRLHESAPQRFLYGTRIGFGIAVRGDGETVEGRDDATVRRTSALKFWSDDPKSLIREGAGYWQYIATDDGIRFLTRYDYRVRFGFLGRALDALLFRRLLSWATAWSFDRLRLWIEKGVDPSVSLERSIVHVLARFAIGFVWIYQGVIPKLICQHADELMMIRQAGVGSEWAPIVLHLIGWGEVLLGIAILALPVARWSFRVTIALMIIAILGVAVRSPSLLTAPFNPVCLNILMIALSVVGLRSSRDLPSARRCLRKQPGAEP